MPYNHTLICVHNDEKGQLECDTLEYKKDKGNISYGDRITIPDGSNNRLMISSKERLYCSQMMDEGQCYVHTPRQPDYPEICTETREGMNGDITRKCGIEIPAYEVASMISDLQIADGLRKGFVKEIIDNDVRIVRSEALKHPILGYANCVHGNNYIFYSGKDEQRKRVNTLLHEFAHCREDIEREEKGLPPLEVGKTGEWKELKEKWGETEIKRTIPIGHEARAVKFEKRKIREYPEYGIFPEEYKKEKAITGFMEGLWLPTFLNAKKMKH